MRNSDKTKPSDQIKKNAKLLRKSQTPPEAILWKQLRGKRLGGFKFRRQYPIGRFIVDFYCHEVALVIEIDGASHESQVEYDLARSQWLVENGYHVIRFSNQQIARELDGVCQTILFKCKTLLGEKNPSPQPSPQGEGSKTAP